MNRRSFDDAEADSLSERLAATTSTRLVRVTAGYGQILGDRQSDGSTQPARPRHGCDGAWFEIEPQRAPGPMWLLESANCADASCNPNCLLFCTSLLHSLCSYQIMEKIRPARRRCTMTPLWPKMIRSALRDEIQELKEEAAALTRQSQENCSTRGSLVRTNQAPTSPNSKEVLRCRTRMG